MADLSELVRPRDSGLGGIADILNRPTAEDEGANSLASIAGGITPNSPISAILKGVVGGVALTKKGKAQTQRDIDNQKLAELAQYQIDLKKYQANVQMQAAAHTEAMQTGMQLAQGIEQAQIGDEAGIKNWLASNPSTQAMLKERIGVPVESAKVTNINGVDVIQAYGRDAQGNIVMDPNPVPVDAYLRAYAPDAYAARAAQRLEQTAATLKNDNLQADLDTERARAAAITSDAAASAAAPSSPAPSGSSAGEANAAPAQTTPKSIGKLTESQGKNTNYGLRMQGAMGTLNDLENSKTFDPTSLWNATLKGISEGEGGVVSWVPGSASAANASLSGDAQRYFQAQKEFLAGILRGDTGAAITNEEFKLYGPMYFPVTGDKPETIKAKATARDRALEGTKFVAGPGAAAIEDAQRATDLKAKYGLE